MRKKNAIYNIVSTLTLQIIVLLYGFIAPKIIISKFGSDVNGLISSITQFLAYISLLESGFGPVVKASLYKPIANKDINKITSILKTSERFFRKISKIFIVYILVLCFIYPFFINNQFDTLYTVSLIIIISISTFAEYFFGMSYRLYLQADQKNYIISIIQIITYILSIIVIVIFTIYGASIQIIKLISGIVFIIRPIFLNIYVRRHYKINLSYSDGNYKLKNKWDGLSQHIAAVIHGNTDITLLTLFSNLKEVSVYSVYYLVITGIKSLISSFTSGIDSIFGDMIARKEKENLTFKFGLYENIYFILCTILFTSTAILIVPFVKIYTTGIRDVNYVRYIFGYLIVISEYIWAIRSPYISITYAAGHFKETRVGAWLECIINILISIILVKKIGIIGVAIGTLIAMTIRTTEFIYHVNKYILNRNIFISIKKISVILVSTIIIFFICQFIPYLNNINYLNWIINAIMVVIISSVVSIIINFIFCKNDMCELFKIFIGRIKK